MKYPARIICVDKPAAAVREALKACASRHGTGNITETDFRLACSRRHNGGNLSLTKLTGTIATEGGQTAVAVSPWAGLAFWIGCGVYLLGLAVLIGSVLAATPNPVAFLGSAVMGSVFVAVDWWEGQSHLERIERKLRG